MCVGVAGGGTAGHVFPAIAFARALAARCHGTRVVFFGDGAGPEGALVRAAGHEFQPLPAAPFHGAGRLGQVAAVARALRGVVVARRRLRALGVQALVGFGGYASVAAVLAARSLSLPVLLHEGNRLPGRANLLLARFADRIHTAVPVPAGHFPAGRTRLTGQPVRDEIAALATMARLPPPPGGPVRILVTGGSLGSTFLDERVPGMLSLAQRRGTVVEVLHQAGRGDVRRVMDRYRDLGVQARCQPFVEDMAAAYREAHFAIASAGVNTLTELALCAIPALLVPLAAAADGHQSENARWAAASGGPLVVEEADWDEVRVAADVHRVMSDPGCWRKHATAMGQLALPGAAEVLVTDCLALLASSA